MKFRSRKTVDSTQNAKPRSKNADAASGTHDSFSTTSTVDNSNSGLSSLAPSKEAFNKQEQNGQYYILYACLAGSCGALSGVVGKLAVASTNAPAVANYVLKTLDCYHAYLPIPGGFSAIRSELMVSVLSWVFRSVFFITNVVFTGQMWRFYLKALSAGPTPVCQILNTGSNFAVSAFIGIVFFLEEVNMMWVCGALMVVLGLALIVMDPQASSMK